MSHRKHDAELARRIGGNILLYRNALALSQARLGLDAGVDQSYIGRIERGHAIPGCDVLMDLCAALECEPNDLLLP